VGKCWYIFVHLEHFTDIWDVLWPFGSFCVPLVHFFRFWYHVPRNALRILTPGSN
jgi:hypothetical protein